MKILIKKIVPQDRDMVSKVGEILSFLRYEYPNFQKWYKAATNEQALASSRHLFIAFANGSYSLDSIAGIMILKNTPIEKKVCTLCVLPDFKNMGIATQLLTLAFDELGTQHPLITVSESRNDDYARLFHNFGFELFKTYSDYYCEGKCEYSYNGPIESCSYIAPPAVNG